MAEKVLLEVEISAAGDDQSSKRSFGVKAHFNTCRLASVDKVVQRFIGRSLAVCRHQL